MLIVHMGTPEAGERFFDERWPGARAVSDPERRLFDAFGLFRGSLGQMFGPRVWVAGLASLRHGMGKPEGDTFVQGGAFVVRGAVVLAADPAEHSGDEADLDALAQVARGAA